MSGLEFGTKLVMRNNSGLEFSTELAKRHISGVDWVLWIEDSLLEMSRVGRQYSWPNSLNPLFGAEAHCDIYRRSSYCSKFMNCISLRPDLFMNCMISINTIVVSSNIIDFYRDLANYSEEYVSRVRAGS